MKALTPNRAVFNALNRRNKAKDPDGRIVTTDSYLRLESADLATQKQITFYIGRESAQQAATVTEQRLSKTDTFTATAFGFGIIKTTTTLVTQYKHLHTYPNNLVFTGTNEALNLGNIYNGSLNITVDGRVYYPAIQMYKFYRVGQAQESVLTAASGTGNAYTRSQWDANTFPYYGLTPTIEFNGASNIEINVNCPASADMAGTSSQNKLVMFIHGFLNQNAASYNN